MSIDKFKDESNEEFAERQRREEYYGIYSNSVRDRLLSINVPKPESIYDVFAIVRNRLLAQNQPSSFIDLDEQGKVFRNALAAKNQNKEIDLDIEGNSARQALLAKI